MHAVHIPSAGKFASFRTDWNDGADLTRAPSLGSFGLLRRLLCVFVTLRIFIHTAKLLLRGAAAVHTVGFANR